MPVCDVPCVYHVLCVVSCAFCVCDVSCVCVCVSCHVVCDVCVCRAVCLCRVVSVVVCRVLCVYVCDIGVGFGCGPTCSVVTFWRVGVAGRWAGVIGGLVGGWWCPELSSRRHCGDLAGVPLCLEGGLAKSRSHSGSRTNSSGVGLGRYLVPAGPAILTCPLVKGRN